MEKPLFPSKYMRITQGYDEGTHKSGFAIDNAGEDSGISDIYAPYTGIIKKIYQNDANEVWLESTDKVEYPDGTIDYMTMLFAHANNVDDLFVGKLVKKDEAFYREGTKGNVSGNHCHMECGRGRFSNSGWHKNDSGYWSLDNGERPEACLWIDDSITILNDNSYNFKKISTPTVEKASEDINNNVEIKTGEVEDEKTIEEILSKQEEIKTEESKEKPKDELSTSNEFIFIAPKTDLYGVYLKENQKLTIEDLT